MLDAIQEHTAVKRFFFGSGNNNDVGWKYNKFHKTTYYFWWEGPTNIFLSYCC